MKYDVIIIGGGAAGLTAAIYTARRAMKTLVISQDIGGQAATTLLVENYPGFESIGGTDLMLKFKKQAEKFGAEFVFDEVSRVEKKEDYFIVQTASGPYETETVILAFGLSHRHLNVEGEEKLIGRGVSYCATCDGPLYKGKTVAVIGGGNSALCSAQYLADLASKVYLIHRSDEFRGEEIMANQLKASPKVELVVNSVVTNIIGEQKVEALTVAEARNPQKLKNIPVEGIFIEIGFVVKSGFIKDLIEVDEKNQIKVSSNNETSVPGIFAAGDVTTVTYKQIVISAGEGSKAALQAYSYLQKKRGKSGTMIDWSTGKKK